MIPPPLEATSLGLGMTLEEASVFATSRLRGDLALSQISFLNLGFPPQQQPEVGLAEALREAGLWTVLHAIDLNLSPQLSSSRLHCLGEAARVLEPRWIEEDLGAWVWGESYLGSHQLEPVLDAHSAMQAAGAVRNAERVLGYPFLVENPPIYLAMGDQDMWTHLLQVAEAADSGIVLDVGHMIGAHINGDRPLRIADYDWPGWPRVREIHLSGFDVRSHQGCKYWTDRHSMSFPKLLVDWADEILARVEAPVAVTLELDGAPEDIVAQNVSTIAALIARRNGS